MTEAYTPDPTTHSPTIQSIAGRDLVSKANFRLSYEGLADNVAHTKRNVDLRGARFRKISNAGAIGACHAISVGNVAIVGTFDDVWKIDADSRTSVEPHSTHRGIAYGEGTIVVTSSIDFYYSTDFGATWTPVGDASAETAKLVAYDGTNFAANYDAGAFYYSTDGTSWSASSGSTGVAAVFAAKTDLFVAVTVARVPLYSTDNGASWSTASAIHANGAPMGLSYNAARGVFVYFGYTGTGSIVTYTSSNGTTWTLESTTAASAYNLSAGEQYGQTAGCSDDDVYYVGAHVNGERWAGVLRSTNRGASWEFEPVSDSGSLATFPPKIALVGDRVYYTGRILGTFAVFEGVW